jgi:hypothetical protein
MGVTYTSKDKICIDDCFFASNVAPTVFDKNEECRIRCSKDNGSFSNYYEMEQNTNNLLCYCDRGKKKIEDNMIIYIGVGLFILIILMLLFGKKNE